MATTRSRPIRLGALAFGGDYNPDQWPERTWHDDIRLMREVGVNLVTLPVFGWPQLEPEPGVYDWEWLDRLIDLLWAAEIRVDLATATATPPAWLIRAHPEMLPCDESGRRLEFGSRQAYCPSSPVWREHVARLCRAMAVRYGEHPALALWHVSNEYGDHIARCWCPESSAHFRRWLQARYGDLESLNTEWGTKVWGQRYIAWDHIEVPRTATGPVNPTQLLDFERFSSDALLELFQLEVEVLREVTPDIAVTTNFMSLLRDLDYWKFAAAEDLVTDDAYPDPADPLAHVAASLNYGLMRSLKGGQPWLLLEQAPSAVSWRDVNVPKPPGKQRTDSLQAIAHGSDGAMFFQWRQARQGQEKFHSALLGHRGERSRTFAEARALGADLKRLEPVRGSRVRARVALVVDWDSWWASSAPESLPSQRLNWLTQARAWHAACHVLGQPVDAVPALGPFDNYEVVIVSNLYIVDAAQAAALEVFVASGGHLIVGPFSGVADPSDRIHEGGAPGPLRQLLGMEIDEQWPLADGVTESVTFAGAELDNRQWSEWLEIEAGTEAVGSYATGELTGRAAVTRRATGDGVAWYVSAILDAAGTTTIMQSVLDGRGLPKRTRIDPHLDVVTRSDDDNDYTFVLNHGLQPLTVEVPTDAYDLLSGEAVSGSMTLPQFGAAVLRTPRADLPPFIHLTDSSD
ncbi:beta-galactosidase [soil metagenome]